MKIIKLGVLCFLLSGIALFFKPNLLFAQLPERDETEKFFPAKTGITEIEEIKEKKDATPLAKIKNHMSEGVKYIPGKHHTGSYEDDDLYTHYIYEQDNKGRTVRKKGYNVGPNNTKITSDEYLKYYVAYEYDKDGRLIKDFSYNGKGPDNIWFTPDDIENYHSVYEYDSLRNKSRIVRYTLDGNVFDYTALETNPRGLIVKDAVYKGKGPDNQWFTPDDEIEKYHRFDYDSNGNLIRAAEYHVGHNGKGKDGVWFTPDDEISSTKVFSYSKEGGIAKIGKYIGPGPDNIWFTDDDKLQYYTIYD